MKRFNKVLLLLLCLIMVMGVLPTMAFATKTEPNVTISTTATEVNVGDTFDVWIGINEMNASSVAFGFDFDKTLLKVTGVSAAASATLAYSGTDDFGDPINGNKEATSVSTKDEANNSGHIGCVWANSAEVTYTAKAQIVRVRFEALKAGTVEFKMFEDSAGTDGYKGEWTDTNTVTITDPNASACTHENKKAEPNGDGTHDVVCQNAECQAVVEDNVTCSGGTATCTEKAKCTACGTAYGELGDHTYGDLILAQEAVHSETTLKGAVAAHYCCEVCDTYFTEEKVETTLDDLTDELPVHAHYYYYQGYNGAKHQSRCFCGYNMAEAEAHTDADGDDKCDVCTFNVHTCAHNHYEITNTTHQSTCKCGEPIGEAVTHSYDHLTSDFECECGAKYTGWSTTYAEDVPYTRYVVDGEVLYGWNEVEDNWYYFSTTSGNRATGMIRVPYPTIEINGETYAPNAEDLAYVDFIDANEAWFCFGEDGKFLSTKTGIENDKYIENGMIPWHPGFVEVEETLYYFVGDAENGGNKLANGEVYVSRNVEAAGFEKGNRVNFVDGKVDVTKNGIVEIAGVKYYFENGKLAVGAGLVEIEEGKYIYVRSSGKLATGSYYLPAGQELASGLYSIDENGYIEEPKYSNVNGIVDGYYYKDGKLQYGAGLIKVGEDIYYVRTSGQVATGKYYITNTNGMASFTAGMKLYFGEDGKMETVKNGIFDEGGVLYYYENNSIAYGKGLIELEDGSIIYVRSNGQVATGKYYITNTNDMEGYEEGQRIVFGENGKYIPGN